MTNQVETGVYAPGIYQWEKTDPVEGGIGNVANLPLLQLANRTASLLASVTALTGNLTGYALINSQAFTGTPSAPTPDLSDRSTRLATTNFAAGVAAGLTPPLVGITATTTIESPAWAVRMEAWLVGCGGGGSNSYGASTQGAGGGAGGELLAVWPCPANVPVVFTIGTRGNSQTAGGNVNLTIGTIQAGTATGGSGAQFSDGTTSSGALGGTWACTGGGVVTRAQVGAPGSDGQCATRYFAGNGAPGPWGGAGRAGAGGRQDGFGHSPDVPIVDAVGYGAGGGGAYDVTELATVFSGGIGGPGIILYRFLAA